MKTSKLMKLTAGLTAALMSTQALAGMDTIINFANLSPYEVTVDFPSGDRYCWYDQLTSSRLSEYKGYYRQNAVSNPKFADYLSAYKSAYGLRDLRDVPVRDMGGNASLTLAAAVSGQDVPVGMFAGETDAHLGWNPFSRDSCKDRDSWRGFNVTLRDDGGNIKSQHRYELTDPAGGAWTLQRTVPGDPGRTAQILTLGSGGQGDPWEIALVATTVVVTAVSLGSFGYQMWAARAAIAEGAALEALLVEVASESSTTVVPNVWRQAFNYAMTRGLSVVGDVGVAEFLTIARSAPITSVVLGSITDGAVIFINSKRQGNAQPIMLADGKESGYFRVPDGSKLDTSDLNMDFSNPVIAPNSGLPDVDDRSICVYQTGTVGITECRLVGIQLTVMPNGSLMFMPMPSVGGGK